MYGMVNKAIQDLVITNYDQTTWIRIKEKANFKDEFFVSMKSYPDQITYDLVGAASEILEIPADEILKLFGEYWILFTANEGYRDVLSIYGKNLGEFLKNLNLLHEQITMVMPNLQPPQFTSLEKDNNRHLLTYQSKREGLKPMVLGLLIGLGKRFDVNLNIEEDPETIEKANIGKYHLSW